MDFRIEWDGVCNVFWNEKYGENVPFSIQTVARFTEVIVHGNEHDDDISLRQRLSPYLDPGDFVHRPIRKDECTYDSGVGMADCRFEPNL
jgi:hypothetical protein